MTGIRIKVLLFAAALLVYTQCLSACTFAPCHQPKPAKCHDTGGAKPCSHESLASPQHALTGDDLPAIPLDMAAIPQPTPSAPVTRLPARLQANPPPVLLTILRL